jgi:exonuclease SbcC
MVSDAWTGHDRDTSTLSGGETFLASLALALGLAEVVTASAGGAPLDALFVDEGFGSLDEEILDEVLDVLDGLREGGRLVGIVSHVPHLRDRIPSRLRVTKATSGSTVSQSDGTGGEDEERLAPHEGAVITLPEPQPTPVTETPEAPFAGMGEQLALLGAD